MLGIVGIIWGMWGWWSSEAIFVGWQPSQDEQIHPFAKFDFEYFHPMTQSQAREILEALADGCSPLSGEVLPEDHILMEESVIEALLIAIELLRGKVPKAVLDIDEEDIRYAVAAFETVDMNPTANRLATFLSGTRAFKNPELIHHPLYGKYGRKHSKGALNDYLEIWVEKNLKPANASDGEPHPYFNEPHFNKLSEKATLQLKEKVVALPMVRVDGLSESLLERRKVFPRSHEPWPDEEVRLLNIALDFTNDLEFLATCFGRSTTAISAQSVKLLEAKKPAQ